MTLQSDRRQFTDAARAIKIMDKKVDVLLNTIAFMLAYR